MNRSLASLAAAVTLAPLSGAAQQAGVSAAISGLVVDAITGQPVGISTIAFVPGVVVNPDGTFEIQNLPPGLSRFVIAGGALSGVLQSASGAPASDVFVLAFSVNRAFWIPGTRRTQAVRPDVDGRYTIKGLPPGDYLVAALTDADENDWNDSRLLEQLVPASIRISLGDGERKVQDLRIGGVLRPR